MREKKDSIFNSEILQQTAHLSHEEFGLFIRMAMVEDDEETQKRYENISGVFLNAYMKIEKQWKEDFKPYTEDIKAMSDYSVIYSSAAKSRKGYNKLKETLDNKKGDNDENTETETTETKNQTVSDINKIRTESISFKNKTKPIIIKFTDDTAGNAPNQKEIDELLDSFDEDIIISMLVTGNIEKWERHYETILQELYEESKQKTESPFDCLKEGEN